MRNKLSAFIILIIPVLLFGCFGGTENASENNSLDAKELEHFAKMGKQYADSAQKMLGDNLKMALTEGGVINAINFCSVQAIQLTDSASKMMDVDLKRISDKSRNPMNTADIEELKLIGKMKSAHQTGAPIDPIMVPTADGAIGYYPIIIQPLCLNCHGIPEREINPETAAVIAQLYPVDKATGYKLNDLRGMWKVMMTEN